MNGKDIENEENKMQYCEICKKEGNKVIAEYLERSIMSTSDSTYVCLSHLRFPSMACALRQSR